MPMYLGNSFVKGVYFGDTPYRGFALGSNTDADDYGVIQYFDPAIAVKVGSWTLNAGTTGASISATPEGIRLQQGFTSGGINMGLSRTLVSGRKYQVLAKISLLSQPAVGQIWEGGSPDGGSVIGLNQGDTYDYTFTATSSNFELQIFSLNLNAGRDIFVEEVYIREVS